jgi:hypothetical protein
MDTAIDTSNADASNADTAVKPKQQPKAEKGANKGSRQNRRPPTATRVGPTPPQFRVDATTIEKRVRIGDTKLSMAVFKNWGNMHRALHYLTDFTRTSLRGRVVAAANRGIAEYLKEKTEQAESMLKAATEKADNDGVVLGKHGNIKEEMLEISCRTENDVLSLVRLLDDYVIVMDSLWIAQSIEDRARDDAHDEVRRTIHTLHQLLSKMFGKMVAYRRNYLDDKLTKSEEIYARDIEVLILDVAGINLLKIREKEEAELAAENAKKAAAKEEARAARKSAAEKNRANVSNLPTKPASSDSSIETLEQPKEIALAA